MASLEQLTLRGIPAEGKNTNSHLQTVNHIDEKGGSFSLMTISMWKIQILIP